jgi:hypothetical protein
MNYAEMFRQIEQVIGQPISHELKIELIAHDRLNSRSQNSGQNAGTGKMPLSPSSERPKEKT